MSNLLHKFKTSGQYIMSVEAYSCPDVFLYRSISTDLHCSVKGVFQRDIDSQVGIIEDFQASLQFSYLTQQAFHKRDVTKVSFYKLLVDYHPDLILTPSDLTLVWEKDNPTIKDIEDYFGIIIYEKFK